MANYTENYDLVKPTMAETADIRTINGNMDTVDTIMHDTQVSMADAFDSTASYAIRDLVMYEFKLYQCIHPHEGPWDADNWVRVNAAETGGNYVEITPTYNSGLKIADTNIDGDQDEIYVPYFGGATAQANGTGGAVPAPTSSDVGKFLSSNGGWETPSGGGGGTTVVPNPVGEPTDELETIRIGDTIFSIPGSGGGAGGSALTDDVIYEDTTGATGVQNITLSKRISDYDAIYFEFYFPSESTYLSANPSPLQRVVEAPAGASDKYSFQTYPSYGNRYILLTSLDGGTSATLTTSAWGEAIYPSVYRIHGIKFGGGSGPASEVIEITAGDNTTSRTFTFEEPPKFIKFYWGDPVISGGWASDTELVWGQTYMNYRSKPMGVSISQVDGGINSVAYGADGKSITITGANAFGAMNTSNGSGLMFVDYGGGGGASDDISDMTWTLLDSTTGTSSGVAIPSGTKYLVLTAELGGYVSMVAKESIAEIDKLASVASAIFNQGYEYADIAGNHTTIAMSVNNNVVTIKSGYNTVTARVYAVK